MPVKKVVPLDPTELKIALDNRAFEITLFGQRSNYFLVLITALGAGVFTIQDPWFSFVISIFASIGSFLWFRTNLGSRFWQESWEVEVTILAKEQGIRSFERSEAEIAAQVEASLLGSRRRWFFRRWIDRQILKKPSVTFNMIVLSLVATLIWSIITIVKGYPLIVPQITKVISFIISLQTSN
ncbi:MAG: hypothetical protein ACK519_11805 [Sphingomonadaceae bacterium]|jgi:hypothetical protein